MVEADMTLRQSYKLATRRKILRAARRCFYFEGFDATSVADIAAAAKVGRATVYLHFATKSEILRALLSETLGDQFEIYRKLTRAEQPITLEFVREWIVSMVNIVVKLHRSAGEFAVILSGNPAAVQQIRENRFAEINLLGERFEGFRVGDLQSDEGRRKMHACLFMLYQIEFFPRYADPADEPMFNAGIDLLAERMWRMLTTSG